MNLLGWSLGSSSITRSIKERLMQTLIRSRSFKYEMPGGNEECKKVDQLHSLTRKIHVGVGR